MRLDPSCCVEQMIGKQKPRLAKDTVEVCETTINQNDTKEVRVNQTINQKKITRRTSKITSVPELN
jgi:hypothetical protein